MKFLALPKLLLSAFSVATLVSCGGGGGGASTATAPVTVPFKAAYANMIKNGSGGVTLNVSGSCGGTATLARGPSTTGVSFDGTAGRISSPTSTTLNLTGCLPATVSTSTTEYLDSTNVPVGATFSGGNYGFYLTPATIPDTITEGTSGTIGTMTLYTNSSKTVLAGKSVLTYTVKSNAPSSLVFALKITSSDAVGTVSSVEEDNYLVEARGNMGLFSATAQTFGASPISLTLK